MRGTQCLSAYNLHDYCLLTKAASLISTLLQKYALGSRVDNLVINSRDCQEASCLVPCLLASESSTRFSNSSEVIFFSFLHCPSVMMAS